MWLLLVALADGFEADVPRRMTLEAESSLPPLPPCHEVLTPEWLFGEAESGERTLIGAARAVFFLPDLLVEGAAALLPTHLELNGQAFFDRSRRDDDFAATFFRLLVRKEQSFFARIGSSEVASFQVQDGLEEIDRHRFDAAQERLVFDVVKRAYRERFHVPEMDFDTAWTVARTGTWADAILIPTFLSAYAYRFGVDRKLKLTDDVRLEFHLERGTRIYRSLAGDAHHPIGALTLNLFRLPVSVICEIEGNEGRLGAGFVGIGTDLGTAMRALFVAEKE
jgi:hypothetical protein